MTSQPLNHQMPFDEFMRRAKRHAQGTYYLEAHDIVKGGTEEMHEWHDEGYSPEEMVDHFANKWNLTPYGQGFMF